MKLLINLYIIFLIMLPHATYADEVSVSTAAKVARNFYFDKSDFTTEQFASIILSDTLIIKKDDIATAFIFIVQPAGFIIVSAEDGCYPIIGYSFDPVFHPNNFPPAFEAWMDGISEQVLFTINHGIKTTNNIRKNWDKYLNYIPSKKVMNTPKTGVEPLLQSTWGQQHYYNAACPIDPDGPGGRAIAGCVAIAMAQVMYYFRYPETGVGEHSYYDNDYGTISANFGETTYLWDEMVNSIFNYPNPAIAELVFHAGVSIETNYGPGGSSSLTQTTENALKTFFNYSDSLRYINFYDIPDSFNDSVVANLNRNLPMIYRGGGFTSSHSFVCDGYQDTGYFHFNWGWNGGYDGYYFTSNLNPGGYDFTFNQAAVMNIFPKENYPVYCSGPDILKTTRGTFTDGSGPLNYFPNNSCSWLISPDNPATEHIQLWFPTFGTEENNDIVSVYQGSSINDPLIATFSGTTLPPHITIDGSVGLIVFESNEETNLQGWQAEYLAYSQPFCTPVASFTSLSKPWFTDGSDPYHYVDNTYCEWLIHPQNEVYDSIASIRVHFHLFDLGAGDTLYFFENDLPQTPPFKKLTGAGIPDTVVCESNTLLMRMVTDDSINSDGWAAGYTARFPVFCSDTTVLSEPNGTINDGSGPKKYAPNANCFWLIEQENAGAFLLTFTEFDLEFGYDQVKIIDYSENTTHVVATFWGDEIPPPLTVESNRLLIAFQSDYSVQHGGWQLDYQALVPGINKTNFSTSFNVFPNPADEYITISNLANAETLIDLKITDITSKEVYSLKTILVDIDSKITVDISKLTAGLYILNIYSQKENYIQKMLIH